MTVKIDKFTEQTMRRAESIGRHVFSHKLNICWCGSMHSWERAKHGICSCKDPNCTNVHIGL